MNVLAIAVILGLGLAWLWGRSEILRRGGWRVGAGLLSVLLVVVGAILTIRNEWFIGLPMAGLGLVAAFGGRMGRNSPRAAQPRPQPAGMSANEARAILGVETGATPAEIRTAYTRLMKRAHPDQGGTAGLAAQLNAARDRLLKG
jgi:hypothetical protein